MELWLSAITLPPLIFFCEGAKLFSAMLFELVAIL
jgi:hypothetical protein